MTLFPPYLRNSSGTLSAAGALFNSLLKLLFSEVWLKYASFRRSQHFPVGDAYHIDLRQTMDIAEHDWL